MPYALSLWNMPVVLCLTKLPSLLGLVVQVNSSILIFLLPFFVLLSLLSYFSLPSLSTLFFFPNFSSSLVGQERCRHCLPLTSWPRMWRERRPCWSSMRRGSRRSGTNRRSESGMHCTDEQTHRHMHASTHMHACIQDKQKP